MTSTTLRRAQPDMRTAPIVLEPEGDRKGEITLPEVTQAQSLAGSVTGL